VLLTKITGESGGHIWPRDSGVILVGVVRTYGPVLQK
jgi:hypothetical protein